MKRPISYFYQGEHLTIAELAAKAGVSPEVMRCRLRVCLMSPEEAVSHQFGTNRTSGPAPAKYAFGGQHLSISEIVALVGRSRRWVESRIEGDQFVERKKRAYTDPDRHPTWPTYTYNGITDTVSGWAKRTGIKKATLNRRLSKNWTIKRALTHPVIVGRPRSNDRPHWSARP